MKHRVVLQLKDGELACRCGAVVPYAAASPEAWQQHISPPAQWGNHRRRTAWPQAEALFKANGGILTRQQVLHSYFQGDSERGDRALHWWRKSGRIESTGTRGEYRLTAKVKTRRTDERVVARLIEDMDRLGLADKTGRPTAQRALQAAGLPTGKTELLAEAVKQRKERGNDQ